MVKNCLSRSYYDAFSNLQLQSACHHSCCAARSRANASCHSRLQTHMAGAPHKSTNVRAAVTMGLDRANPAQSAHFSFLRFLMWNLALTTVWCTFCRPHLPKVFRALRCFQILKCKSNTRHGPVHFLPTTFPDPAPNQRKQRRRWWEC